MKHVYALPHFLFCLSKFINFKFCNYNFVWCKIFCKFCFSSVVVVSCVEFRVSKVLFTFSPAQCKSIALCLGLSFFLHLLQEQGCIVLTSTFPQQISGAVSCTENSWKLGNDVIMNIPRRSRKICEDYNKVQKSCA